jgi:hypothetical protein
MLVAASIYLWTAALGVNRRDEISAGARAILLMVVWWAIAGFLMVRFFRQGPRTPISAAFLTSTISVSPGGVAALFDFNASRTGYLLPLVLNVVAHVVLFVWFVRRYGKSPAARIQSPRTAKPFSERLDWLGPPRRSPLGAIAWKQFRESSQIAVAGLAGVFVVSLSILAAHFDNIREQPDTFLHAFVVITMILAIPTVLVVGIGVSLNDNSSRLNTFWRSRPIDPSTWYWTKLLAGALVLALWMLVPVMVMAVAFTFTGTDAFWYDLIHNRTEIFEAIGMFVAMYVSAVAMTCLVRQPIYAAILSVGSLAIAPVTIVALQRLRDATFYLFGSSFGLTFVKTHYELCTILLMAATSVAMVITGWLATRNDWGVRGQ